MHAYRRVLLRFLFLLLPLGTTTSAPGQTPVTLKPPKPSAEFVEAAATAEEPLIKTFSLEQAARSLDAGAVNFSQKYRCVQCHANLMYLTARPALQKILPAPPDMRAFHEWIIETRWEKWGVVYDAWSKDQPAYQAEGAKLPATEPIIVAFGLATHDRATTGKLHADTRLALQKVLERQRPDGGFNIVSDGLGSFLNEFDQTMLAAIAVGSAPDEFLTTEPARRFVDGLRGYLTAHPAAAPYQQGMLLWAATLIPDLMNDEQRLATVTALRTLQRTDGGWCLAELLADQESQKTGKFASSRPSDGYGTGFALFALRNAGVPSSDPLITKGVAWLKANQRESGRWFQPSFVGRPAHLISNSATAWAVMGLAACGEAEVAP